MRCWGGVLLAALVLATDEARLVTDKDVSIHDAEEHAGTVQVGGVPVGGLRCWPVGCDEHGPTRQGCRLAASRSGSRQAGASIRGVM